MFVYNQYDIPFESCAGLQMFSGDSSKEAKAIVLLMNLVCELNGLVQQLQIQTSENTKLLQKELQQRALIDGHILGFVRDGDRLISKSFILSKLAAAFFRACVKPKVMQVSWFFLFDDQVLEVMDSM